MVNYIKKHKALFLIILPALIYHMIIIMPSGSYYCRDGACGIYFWGAHNHDAIWHLAVASFSFSSFPFQMPIFSGAELSGYNMLLDIVLYIFSLFGIPPIISYFKLLPLVWFILFAGVAVVFARKIKDSALFVGAFLFFLFFGGSFAYFLTLFHNGTIWGSGDLLAIQGAHMTINLQFSFSIPILFGILFLLSKKLNSTTDSIVLGVLVALNFGLKFYGGVLSLFFAVIYLAQWYFRKKNIYQVLIQSIIVVLPATFSILFFYNPFSALSSGSVFILSPFAIVHSIIEDPSLFYLKDQVLARYSLQSVGWSPRLFLIEFTTMFLFILLNLGTRFVGLIYFILQLVRKKISRLEWYIIGGIIFSTVLAVAFIQKGVWWNTVQFFYYAIVLSNIFAAKAVYEILKRKNLFLTIVGITILIFTLPTSIDLLRIFTSRHALYIEKGELQALSFLKDQEQGIVFHSFDKNLNSNYSFYSYEDTSYIPAFTGKQSYLANFVQLKLTGIDYENRLNRINKLDCSIFNEVDYVYYVNAMKKELITKCKNSSLISFVEIFENNKVSILKKQPK